MNKAYLLIDFGSTFTKLTLVDIVHVEVVATAKAQTTVETNIMDGFKEAYQKLSGVLPHYHIVKRLACSSAAGGLKMVTIGLVPELTTEASKRAALGAGARVLKTYSFQLTKKEIDEINAMAVDMVLLSGGTDGGNEEVILHNARMLGMHLKDIPVIVAGNKSTYDAVEEFLINRQAIFTENVMPRLNEINVAPVRECIRELFMENITKAKGMGDVEGFIDGILMPTPAAVLKASHLLAKGTDRQAGLGDLIVIDIGGATTDVHSMADGYPSTGGVELKGLREPYQKRTVEGDLGMRYSALSLLEDATARGVHRYLTGNDEDISEERKQEIHAACQKRHEHPDFIASDEVDMRFDEALAKVATKQAMRRHAGRIETVYTPFGEAFNQYGKDLIETKWVIGTGGVLVHSERPLDILKEARFDQASPTVLCPKAPTFYLDQDYILSTMGILSDDHPDIAFQLLKKMVKRIEGE